MTKDNTSNNMYHIIINHQYAHEFKDASLAWDWYNSLARNTNETRLIELRYNGVTIASNDKVITCPICNERIYTHEPITTEDDKIIHQSCAYYMTILRRSANEDYSDNNDNDGDTI